MYNFVTASDTLSLLQDYTFNIFIYAIYKNIYNIYLIYHLTLQN